MERVAVTVNRKNGEAAGEEAARTLTFTGERIASFSLPYDGEERRGSMGMDFKLYRSLEHGFILTIESWSRRKEGKNLTVFEVFKSIEEMKEKTIFGESYSIKLPDKLIIRAESAVGKREIRPPAQLPGLSGSREPADNRAY